MNKPTTSCVNDGIKLSFKTWDIRPIISDNGPQYLSKQFHQFCRECGFIQATSSPRYPRSNRLAEDMVKDVTNMIRKSQRAKQGVQKGLLLQKNTIILGKITN